MPTLSVRGVPEPLLASLRRRAERHSRSLQKEVLVLLQESVALDRAIVVAAIEASWQTQPVHPSAEDVDAWLAEGRKA